MSTRWMKPCPSCKGRRVIHDPRWTAFAAQHNLADRDPMRDCPECGGIGKKITQEGEDVLELVGVGFGMA